MNQSDKESIRRETAELPLSPNINPQLTKSKRLKRKYTLQEYIDGITSGNRTILSQAITLVESSLPGDYDMAQAIVEKCLLLSAQSVRIAVTGVPGAGKSTFIETFGMHIVGEGRKLAVLTVDPSSEQTKGSILGDKTRMDLLSAHPNAFIRPSPSTGTLGGVARKTRETIILCEAAGFNTILIETVGVGQSETEVHSMVDFFLLLMLSGAGDELQGIKRGIMEIADLVAITKADGSGKLNAEMASVSYQNALHLFPPKPSGWMPRVMTCSAKQDTGVREIWETIREYLEFSKKTGYFELLRKQQAVIRMNHSITEYLKYRFYNSDDVREMMPELERLLYEGKITSYKAASLLLDKYFKSRQA